MILHVGIAIPRVSGKIQSAIKRGTEVCAFTAWAKAEDPVQQRLMPMARQRHVEEVGHSFAGTLEGRLSAQEQTSQGGNHLQITKSRSVQANIGVRDDA
jgi:hypothetical protein